MSEQASAYSRPTLYARSIYDVYPPSGRLHDHRFSEPRLDVFPPNPHALASSRVTAIKASSALSHDTSLVKPISRPGGMRISALLNEDPIMSPPSARNGPLAGDTFDASSDGTVSERDVESGASRPSPRSAALGMAPFWAGGDRYERPRSVEAYRPLAGDPTRSSSATPYYEVPAPPPWPRKIDTASLSYFPHRPSTTAPSFGHQSRPQPHQASWDRPSPRHPPLGVGPPYHLSSDRDRDRLPPPLYPRGEHRLSDQRLDRQPDWRRFVSSPGQESRLDTLPPIKMAPPRDLDQGSVQ